MSCICPPMSSTSVPLCLCFHLQAFLSFQLCTTFISQNPNTTIYVLDTLDSRLALQAASHRQCPRKTMVSPYLFCFPGPQGQLPVHFHSACSSGTRHCPQSSDPKASTCHDFGRKVKLEPRPDAKGSKKKDLDEVAFSGSGCSKISVSKMVGIPPGDLSNRKQLERLVRPSQMLELV